MILSEILTDERVISLTLWFIGILIAFIGVMGGIIFKIGKWAVDQWKEAQPEKAKRHKENIMLMTSTLEKSIGAIRNDIAGIKLDVHQIKDELRDHKDQITTIRQHLKIKN